MLKRVLLNLARSPEFPQGSSRHGYEIVAPLHPDGRLDEAAWKAEAKLCRVRRFWDGDEDRLGWLVHRPGGAGGSHWTIDYDRSSTLDDEPIHRLSSHRLAPGEYLSISDPDGEDHTFRVVDVRAA